MRTMRPTWLIGCTTLTILLMGPSSGQAAPDLWGVDEDDGQLFRVEDYDATAPIFTDFGQLQIDEGFGPVPVGDDIEAATLAPDGTLFMAVDDGVAGFSSPTLITFDIDDASTTSPNVVRAVGSLGVPFDFSTDNVSGLSIDPLTGKLWALLKNGNENRGNDAVDELWVIPDPNNDPLNATFVGRLKGENGKVLQGEDLEFDARGRLYVVDDRSSSTLSRPRKGTLWQIKLKRNASDEVKRIKDVVSKLKLSNVFGVEATDKFEALGWDFENNRLIGSDDDNDAFAMLLGPDSVLNLGDLGAAGQLTDVEGIDFEPGGAGPPPVPEPGIGVLLLTSLVGVWWRVDRASA